MGFAKEVKAMPILALLSEVVIGTGEGGMAGKGLRDLLEGDSCVTGGKEVRIWIFRDGVCCLREKA